jgi:hypothetical protein
VSDQDPVTDPDVEQPDEDYDGSEDHDESQNPDVVPKDER